MTADTLVELAAALGKAREKYFAARDEYASRIFNYSYTTERVMHLEEIANSAFAAFQEIKQSFLTAADSFRL